MMQNIRWTKSTRTILDHPAVELMTFPKDSREIQICGRRGSIYIFSERPMPRYRVQLQTRNWGLPTATSALLEPITVGSEETIFEFKAEDLDVVLKLIDCPINQGRQVTYANREG